MTKPRNALSVTSEARPPRAVQAASALRSRPGCGAQAAPARDQRPRCSRGALGGTRRPTCPRAAPLPGRARARACAGSRTRSRSSVAGQADRRACALCRKPALRLGRRKPDPGGETRFREGGQGACRDCRPRKRAGLSFLRRVDAGAAGERLCSHAAVPEESARSQPRIRGIFRTLQAHRRSADRRRRRRHDDGHDPQDICRSCAKSWCRSRRR